MKYSHRVTTRSHNSRLNQHRLQVPSNLRIWLPVIAQRHPKSHGNAYLDKSTRMLGFVQKAGTCELVCTYCHFKEQNLTILKNLHRGPWSCGSSNGCHFLPLISIQTGLGWAVAVRWQVGGLCAKGRRKTMALDEGNRKEGLGKKIVLQSIPYEVVCKDHSTSLRVY